MLRPRALGLVAMLLPIVACTGDDAIDREPSPIPTVEGLGWEALAPMPTPRTEVAAATDGERIVVAGGFDGGGDTVATVEVLDLDTGSWGEGPSLPLGVNHAMATVLDDGTIVVLGGYRSGLSAPSDRVFALRDDGWDELAPMPAPRGAGGAATVDGSIYVAGGVGPAGLAEDAFVLDPGAGTWSTIDGPPTGREHLGVAGYEGDLFVVGGRTGGIGSNLDAAEAYDAGARTWRELPAMPTARGGIAATASSNGFVVAAGGEADATFTEAEAFDVEEGRWLVLPPMPTARHGLGVVAVGTVVFVIAGGTEPGLSVSDVVEAIDLASLRS